MIYPGTGIEVHICQYCDYAIRDETPVTLTGREFVPALGVEVPAGEWRPVTLDDGPNVFTWHSACAAEIDEIDAERSKIRRGENP